MCGGDFMSKNPEEAMDFLSYVAEVSRGWDELNKGEVGKMKSQPNASNTKAGMYTLNKDVDMKAKFAAMTRRLEELELKKMHEVQAVAELPVQIQQSCLIFQSYEHLVEECPTMPAVKEMFGDQANVIGQFRPNTNAPYGNTYNSSWRNHPNFSWKPRAPQYQQSSQPSQQASSLEQTIVNLSKVVGDFVGDQKAINSQLSQRIDSEENTLNKRMDEMQNDLSQKIDNLQYSISRLTNLNTVQEKGRFPSQPHQNPRVELPTPKPHVEEGEEEETKKREEIKGKKEATSERKEDHDSILNANLEKMLIKEEMLKKHTSPPFPQALHGKKGIRNASEMLEVLRQVKVNIPLLDMIKQVPTYAKFLKDLCTIKRGLNVNKKAFLMSNRFVVLDTDPIVTGANFVPIILGRPFLATSNAIINCRNGLMQLTFGNMTLELNIFYKSKSKSLPEEEEVQKSIGDLEEGLPEPSDLLTTLQGWRRKEEILPLFNKEEAQKVDKEETPKLNLKPLPMELKYTYLEKINNALLLYLHLLLVPMESVYLKFYEV
ncbi:hypothetical protein CK203_070994 [Vitis vinifera]|uniref:Retrotransposon gag domain-containing protein n=1 Tax=Vitis vinifera TaxID=29760 RepID=A0A438E9P8_VITVI|nr:hypothetical protein CK203_070994 [Vitis vinifera]